jgi:hypothetical protein
MSWPLITDFMPLLTQPRLAFADARLKQCVVVTNSRGQPVPRSGQFATVFKAHAEEGEGPPVAIRLFSRRVPERRERYEVVSDYLKRHSASSLVDFSYQEKGIRSANDGRLYPLVVMDWVEGPNLFEWTQERCRQRDAESIALQADQWLSLVDELVGINVGHGDLQHGNVLVSPEGALRLVDYDCLFVPLLAGRVNFEVGIPPYQHPSRDEATLLSGELQRFSALLIFVALRALAAWPDLWDEHVERSQYDKLLFRSSDLAQPERSVLCGQLTNSSDHQLRFLADALLQAYHNDVGEVPDVRDVAEEMSGPLDPYRDWLRIDTANGEFTHYDLLDIDPYEDDPGTIRAATERRLEQIVHRVSASTQDVAARLMREINAAQLTLLDPDSRRRYDEQLNAEYWDEQDVTAYEDPRIEDNVQRLSCPFCHVSLNVPLAMLHSSLRCPTCGKLITAQRA